MEGTVTDHPHDPDDPISDPFDTDYVDAEEDDDDDDDWVEAVFIAKRPATVHARDPYDLGWLFLCWAWESRSGGWSKAVRALARALRGLEQAGLIERRNIKRAGRPTHHGFVLTDEGREAVTALSGDWIKGVDR